MADGSEAVAILSCGRAPAGGVAGAQFQPRESLPGGIDGRE